MSKKYFVFKTTSLPPKYIGFNKEPAKEYEKDPSDKIFGLEYTGDIEGTKHTPSIPYEDGNLVLIENNSAQIETLKDFHEKYGNITSGVKLVIGNEYSKSVKQLLESVGSSGAKKAPAKKAPAKKSAKKAPAKKSAKKAPAKKSAKKAPAKKSAKKGGSRKGGSRKGGSRKGGSRKGGSRKGGSRKGGSRKGVRK
jgi:hypothetical protein